MACANLHPKTWPGRRRTRDCAWRARRAPTWAACNLSSVTPSACHNARVGAQDGKPDVGLPEPIAPPGKREVRQARRLARQTGRLARATARFDRAEELRVARLERGLHL